MGGERQDVNETARIVRVRCDVDDNRCSHIESLNQTTAFGKSSECVTPLAVAYGTRGTNSNCWRSRRHSSYVKVPFVARSGSRAEAGVIGY